MGVEKLLEILPNTRTAAGQTTVYCDSKERERYTLDVFEKGSFIS